MSNELGIERIKETFTEVIDTATKVGAALQDGFQITDLWVLATEAKDIPVIIASGKASLAEFKDLDTEESAELSIWFAENFDIEDDELEAKIEEGVQLLAETHLFVTQGVDLFGRWKVWVDGLSTEEE